MTIVGLVGLGFIWHGWFGMTLFGLLCMIRLRKQHVIDHYAEELSPLSYILSWGALLVFLLSFNPIPLSIQ